MLDKITQMFPEEKFMVPIGFDGALIGVDYESHCLVYSINKCIELLVEQGMDEDEAIEYFDFNVAGAYVGEKTPIWVYDF
jgi:hypothetical protein